MAASFLRKLFQRNAWRAGLRTLDLTRDVVAGRKDVNSVQIPSISQRSTAVEGKSLFAFVDLKDPFAAGEIAGEELPGPILSIMSARKFNSLYLFFTPHTRANALATIDEITSR